MRIAYRVVRYQAERGRLQGSWGRIARTWSDLDREAITAVQLMGWPADDGCYISDVVAKGLLKVLSRSATFYLLALAARNSVAA
jgi:hypothetical protein